MADKAIAPRASKRWKISRRTKALSPALIPECLETELDVFEGHQFEPLLSLRPTLHHQRRKCSSSSEPLHPDPRRKKLFLAPALAAAASSWSRSRSWPRSIIAEDNRARALATWRSTACAAASVRGRGPLKAPGFCDRPMSARVTRRPTPRSCDKEYPHQSRERHLLAACQLSGTRIAKGNHDYRRAGQRRRTSRAGLAESRHSRGDACSYYHRENLQERLAKLAGGVASSRWAAAT